jgi:hypothetical protein
MKSLIFSILVSCAVGASISLASTAAEHKAHRAHKHGEKCGHTPISHGDHVDYLHDGHTHHQSSSGKVEEHKLQIAGSTVHVKAPTEGDHKHGVKCGHERIEHGDHSDYVVDGKVHHVHGDHCDLYEVKI